MSLCFEELKTIPEFLSKLLSRYIDYYEFVIKDLKVQYKNYIRNISYSNLVRGMFKLLPEYSDYVIKLHRDDVSIFIIIDDPEIYALLSLYLL